MFDYKGERMPVPTLDTLAKKSDATLTPIYSDTPTFNEWVTNDDTFFPNIEWDDANECWIVYTSGAGQFTPQYGGYDHYSTSLGDDAYGLTATRTRTDILGYTLGDQDTKPLASEAEAETLRTGKRDYLDLTYNTKRKVVGPAWELKYHSGDVTDTATLYVVESGTSGGYDYESWSRTSANNLSVTFQLVGYNSGTHGGYFSWGTTHGNLSSASLDTTSFEGSLISGEKVSEYEVEDKNNLALAAKTVSAVGNVAALDAHGNPTDSGIPSANMEFVDNKQSMRMGMSTQIASGKTRQLALGDYSETSADGAIAIGVRKYNGSAPTKATADSSIAIGQGAQAAAEGATQIGYSSTANDKSNSLRFMDTEIVDGNGKIPTSNLDKEIVTKEELEDGVTTDEIVADSITIDGKECATKDLVGQEFNFATTQGFMNAIAACVRALGGTVKNNPSEQQQGGN